MMDGAYFTSRKDILDFFNSLLCMSLTKIEQTATGAVACQLMDYLFPGSVPMKRVNWEAKSDFQFIENYKVLQVAFTKNRVQKHIDVDRLIRAKYQDNLEFCQWLKAFFEHAAPAFRDDYDPVARRTMGKGGKHLEAHFLPSGRNKSEAVGTKSRSIASSSASVTSTSTSKTSKRLAANPNATSSGCAPSRTSNTGKSNRGGNNVARINPPRVVMGEESFVKDANLLKKNSELKTKNAELELLLDGVEKERDFYFEKLRGIEVMLQVHEERGQESDPEDLIQQIFKVLYAKSEDNVHVNDEGEVSLECMIKSRA